MAGALAVPAVTVGCEGSSVRQPTPQPPPTQLTEPAGRQLDLASRWRHIEPHVSRPGLVAAWAFDEGSGYAFLDRTGNGHDLFIDGTRWNTSDSGLLGAIHRAGIRGSAVYLDGTRWLQARRAPRLGTSATMTAWVRPDHLQASAHQATLLRIGSHSRLWVDGSGALNWSTGSTGSPHTVTSPSQAVVSGRWTHAAVVVRSAAGSGAAGSEVSLYVDGLAVVHRSAPPITLAESDDPLVLGENLVGALDETTIDDRPLDATELWARYAVGLPTLYTRSSQTIDAEAAVWNRFAGSEPIPHPVDAHTALTLRFDGTAASDQGHHPTSGAAGPHSFRPGLFGAAWRADGGSLGYALAAPAGDSAGSGTAEAWYHVLPDPTDPGRRRRKELLHMTGSSGTLSLFTEAGRWQAELRDRTGDRVAVTGPPQRFIEGSLEHVAVTWSSDGSGGGLRLYVNGVPAGRAGLAPGATGIADQLMMGGQPGSAAFCLVDDVRISTVARTWGDICPRGQQATEAAGLDLRDRFRRPSGTPPLLWRPGSATSRWTYLDRPWVEPARTGDDPASRLAIYQPDRSGQHPLYHPDAFGHASSIEAGVSFPQLVDGWAGVFVQASAPGEPFAAVSFDVNPVRGLLRLAERIGGRVVRSKVLPYDFPMASRSTYELTLTSTADGLVRGFVDGNNLVSTRRSASTAGSGFAGLLTDSASACFENLHFCALTPATSTSRRVRVRVDSYGAGVSHTGLAVTPFRWRKRRGLVPWRYISKDPEPPGNIAGADSPVPPRPIPPAFWRSEDSANSDLIFVDGRVVYFMRGNPRVNGRSAGGRIGVLLHSVGTFDALHFHDPNRGQGLHGPTLLQEKTAPRLPPDEHVLFQLNSPSSAYAGGGLLLFVAKEIGTVGTERTRRLVYAYFDVRSGRWLHQEPRYVEMTASGVAAGGATPPSLSGSPEVVSLRDPDDDGYRAVLYHQVVKTGSRLMAATGLHTEPGRAPTPDPALPTVTSLARPSNGAIYGFRVLFDNGIYYLHYNEGPHVPDWPLRFVLASALDPYAGPWIVSPLTAGDDSTYFRRGSEFEPDNGAIWQGTMVKHRGCYYQYYENYHSIGDVNAPYQHYNAVQAGSRVGFATA